MTKINESLSFYVDHYGRLPCPASLSAKPDDEDYGTPLDCAKIMQSKTITTDAKYIMTGDPELNPIIIGRLPYRELNVPQKDSKDAWGNDIYYAVTGQLTQIEDYSQYNGAIDVIDEYDHSLVNDGVKAQYVLLSNGPDNETITSKTCKKDEMDGENCDGDGTFRSTNLALAEGKSHYDDIISYVTWVTKYDQGNVLCSISGYLSGYSEITEADIKQNVDKPELLNLKPGEMVFLCNKHLLKKMDKKNCMLFTCLNNNVLQVVETIN